MKKRRLHALIEEDVFLDLHALSGRSRKKMSYHVEEALKAYLKGQKRPPK
jgi:hypothetical protein